MNLIEDGFFKNYNPNNSDSLANGPQNKYFNTDTGSNPYVQSGVTGTIWDYGSSGGFVQIAANTESGSILSKYTDLALVYRMGILEQAKTEKTLFDTNNISEKYYVRFEYTPTIPGENGQISCGLCGAAPMQHMGHILNTLTKDSLIYVRAQIQDPFSEALSHVPSDSLLPFIHVKNTDGIVLRVSGIIVISLSKIFGLGNEPNKAWCDENVTYENLYVKKEDHDPMAGKLVWDNDGQRTYETGVDRGVLYLKDNTGAYKNGVAWNGLTAVTESPSGAEATPLYADNIKYLNLKSVEEFGATIEAYTYPDEFRECDGSAELATGVYIGQQPRKQFGFCYRTVKGNDTLGEAYGYLLHLIYGCDAAPSEKGYQTINDSPDAITFSWEVTTTPVAVDNDHKPTAQLIVDSTAVNAEKLAALETILYGSETAEPRMPLPAEVAEIVGTTGG